ncbi:MAG: AsmA family protein [Bacteroidota bacterium]
MRKIVKPLLITLLSILLLLIVSVSFAIWFVFTPEHITPVVKDQTHKFLTCQTELDEVELTFFSTFPRFGLRVNNLLMVNPLQGAPSDTLARIENMTGTIDVMAFWRRNEVILSELSLENGFLNAYIDSTGKTNFDVFALDTTATEQDTLNQEGEPFQFVDLGEIILENVDVIYDDDLYKIRTDVNGINAGITGKMEGDFFDAVIDLKNSFVSFDYAGELYLDQADVKLLFPTRINLPIMNIAMDNANATINGLSFNADGWFEMDTLTGDIRTDIDFDFTDWPLKKALGMTPAAYIHYLDGMQADGLVSSTGNVSGTYNDSVYPFVDMDLSMRNGSFVYADYDYLPLSDINGEMSIYTDFLTDELSNVQITSLSLNTPQSTISTQGKLEKIFSDIHCDLVSDARLTLDEFKPLIPDTINMDITGIVDGEMKSVFSVKQLEEVDLDNMLFSGSLSAINLDVVYDTIWVQTDRTDVSFALPNLRPSSSNTSFAGVNLRSAGFLAGVKKDYSAFFSNATIGVEMSDVRDTTRIPDLLVSFKMDTLWAGNDTLHLALKRPDGRTSVRPVDSRPMEPAIQLSYNSEMLKTMMNETSASMEKIRVNTDIVNDESQEDIFLKWLARGFIDMENGRVEMAELTHPIEIPAIKMDFEPELFDIQDSRIIIDNSDFQLTGKLANILSYFRGDSILFGRFDFVSDNTDVTQLMNLTNGLGYEEQVPDGEETSEDQVNMDSDSLTSGPYMVPKGIDILLSTNVKRATFGKDTAVNISGDVRLSDGILVLGELSFTTPATRMLATAMYKTPRKNHIYLGLDLHMLDIQIEKLLEIIPDIDTIMPMLRSFRGEGEYHMSIETYMDSTYALKMSTLRGSASIAGQDLVLLDGETFTEIAKTLRFSKKAENRVDSLSAEFTVFRREIDIYPFLIVMDRYRAVVDGRHNLDMSFNYNISLVDSPLPVNLGINVKGTLDDMQYIPTAPKYGDLYRPARRGVVQAKKLELRQLIRESLKENLEEEINEDTGTGGE